MVRPLSRPLSLCALALALPLVLGAPAMATTITLDKVGSTVFGANGNAAVKITDAALIPNGQNVLAGGFEVKVTAGSHGIAHLANSFTAWCLDIAHSLKLASNYSVTTTPFTVDPLTSVQKGSILALFNTGYAGAPVAGNVASAGFQLALWEIVNETSGVFDLADGSFKASGNAAAVTAANSLLAGLTAPASQKWRVIYLESETKNGTQMSQNLVTVAAVPLPAAGFLLLGALGMMGLARRRRQGENAASDLG